MKTVSSDILHDLRRPDPRSHKGQNGRILIIAGSGKYHGSLLLAIGAASRIVDMVYVHTNPKNMELVQQLRSEIATFIAVSEEDVWQTVELVDVVIIGPGLDESDRTVGFTKKLLTEFRHKKAVVDATSLWHLDPSWLHERCILAPHSREFEKAFGESASAEAAHRSAARYHCSIALKGAIDYVTDGRELWQNTTGNVGMTKGGTGDVLVGLIGALAATNDCLTAALAGVYLNGLAGDRLYERVGTFYNAEDLMEELGRVWWEELRFFYS